MSAVDDADARLCRLEEALQIRRTELLEVSTQRRYNAVRGIDEALDGRSVAALELSVVAARNVVYHTGLLAGKSTYVRAHLEPREAATDTEPKRTQKRPLGGSPCWQEALVFTGITMVHATVTVEVIQEERFGADQVVGAATIELSALHDQRLHERWLDLHKNGAPTSGQLYVACRLDRSRIFALELECELLENQIIEVRDFVQRQRQFSLSLNTSTTMTTRYLEGKETLLQAHQRRL
ncbi:hypothetical protein ATCC90586_001351 [Pythium insidiosum]|nr:hypothetical protein ATCC90586_001351 [Pythium insidiosum]